MTLRASSAAFDHTLSVARDVSFVVILVISILLLTGGG